METGLPVTGIRHRSAKLSVTRVGLGGCDTAVAPVTKSWAAQTGRKATADHFALYGDGQH